MIKAGSLSVVSNQIIVCVIVYSVFFFSIFADAGGFDSLLQQLPELGVFRKIFDSRIELNVMDYGAKGDGIEDDTKVFADVWDMACSSKVESRIIIPDGSYCLVKPISLGGHCHSKVTLVISGSIVAPSDPDVWDNKDTHKWLYFHSVDHLTVEGGGTIDGMGQRWWATSCKTDPKNPCRHAPTAITFHRCNNLVVKNLMIVNGQQMQMAFTTCDTVAVSHVSVFSPASSPNTDGIHISESTNVEIKDTTVRTGDDCISIVSNSSKVQVRRIVCGPGHGISIGSLGKSDTCDQVYDVSVRGAFLSNTENGLRIKTWQGGSGFVRNVTFEDVWMQNVSHPIIIDQYYCDSDKPCPNKTSAVNVENVSFVNIGGTSATMEAIVFACSDVSPCEGVYLEDVEIVSAFGGVTTSFCWQVNGSTAGYVYPPICYSTCKSFIKQTISSATKFQAI
ncbi:putative endo-polygalacturonase [Helianthus annuus]|nr:putative endo-polygalacturonase [Helianthus annuus]